MQPYLSPSWKRKNFPGKEGGWRIPFFLGPAFLLREKKEISHQPEKELFSMERGKKEGQDCRGRRKGEETHTLPTLFWAVDGGKKKKKRSRSATRRRRISSLSSHRGSGGGKKEVTGLSTQGEGKRRDNFHVTYGERRKGGKEYSRSTAEEERRTFLSFSYRHRARKRG